MSKIEYTIRAATVEDAPVLLEHRRKMFRAMGRDEASLEPMSRAAAEYYATALADGTCRAWLAVSGGDVAGGGMIVIVPWPGSPGFAKPWRPWILNVYVDPAFRRRGIARALMETMIGFCREEGYPAVALHASDEGRPLYESLGFEPTNEMRLVL